MYRIRVRLVNVKELPHVLNLQEEVTAGVLANSTVGIFSVQKLMLYMSKYVCTIDIYIIYNLKILNR